MQSSIKKISSMGNDNYKVSLLQQYDADTMIVGADVHTYGVHIPNVVKANEVITGTSLVELKSFDGNIVKMTAICEGDSYSSLVAGSIYQGAGIPPINTILFIMPTTTDYPRANGLQYGDLVLKDVLDQKPNGNLPIT